MKPKNFPARKLRRQLFVQGKGVRKFLQNWKLDVENSIDKNRYVSYTTIVADWAKYTSANPDLRYARGTRTKKYRG